MRTAQLGDVAEFINGMAFKPEDWHDNGLPIIRIQNLTDPSKPINKTNRKAPEKYKVKRGDILVSWSATLGVFTWERTDEALVNQHIFRVVPNTSLINPDYLRHILEGALASMEQHLHGATMKHVNRGEFLATRIPLPPLAEQRRIAAILDHADALGHQRTKVDDLIDALLWASFHRLLGSGDWPAASLADCSQAIIDCPHSTPKWTSEGEVCIRTSNLTKGGWDWSDKRFVSLDSYESRSHRAEVNAGDIVLSREGTVGVAAIVEPGQRLCLGQRLVQIRTDTCKATPEYLLHYLLFALSPERISHLMVGSTARHLNVRELRELPIPVPPMHMQVAFSTELNALNALRLRSRRAGQIQLELFASLQSRAFSGQL